MMPDAPRAWIFQGTPDLFDLDGYLRDHRRIVWRVRQHAREIRPGDDVFIWRAQGKAKAEPGVVAHAVVASEVWNGPDSPESLEYWHDPVEGAGAEDRVDLEVRKVA